MNDIILQPSCEYTSAGFLQGRVSVIYDIPDFDQIVISGPNGFSGSTTPGTATGFAVFFYLPNGNFLVEGKKNGVTIRSNNFDLDCGNSQSLAIVSVTPTDASSKTAIDGSATASIVYGVYYGPDYIVQTSLDNIFWTAATVVSNSNYAATYTGIAAGQYTLYARVFKVSTNAVLKGATAQYTFVVGYAKIYGCTNPAARNYDANATDDDGSCVLPPLVPKAHFIVPMMNSLRFVNMALSTQPATMDNRLYCAEDWQGISRPHYYQKVTRDDLITTQFQSNYANHTVSLINYQTNNVITTFAVDNKQQNIGILLDYPAFLTAEPADVSKSRLYFNSGTLPLAFVVGDRVEIKNATPAGLNKEYGVSGVGFDVSQSVPFITVNMPYPAVAPIPPRINVTAQTQYDSLPYNVFESTANWDLLPVANGGYYITIEANDRAFKFFRIEAPNPSNNIALTMHLTQWLVADGAIVAPGDIIGKVNQGGTAGDIIASVGGVFVLTTAPSNVNDILVGQIIGKIKFEDAARAGFNDILFRSEPISLYAEQPGTNLITWRNFDDAEGLSFTTGLNCGIRVESEGWQRFPGGTRKTYRSPSNRLIKLSAQPQRKIKLNTFWLPPWLHEKLARAFDLDHVEINGEEFQSEDGYGEPQYVSRYALSNSSITLEKVEDIDTNSDDLGDINGTAPFIVVNDDKFIQI